MPVTVKQNQPSNKNELYFTIAKKQYTVSYKNKHTGEQVTREKSVVYLIDGKGAICGIYGNEKLARMAIPKLRERIVYLSSKYNYSNGKIIPNYYDNRETVGKK